MKQAPSRHCERSERPVRGAKSISQNPADFVRNTFELRSIHTAHITKIQHWRYNHTHTMLILPQSFFSRDAEVVARDLLGREFVYKNKDQIIHARITETEAYDGETDLACHASKGRTKRTEGLYTPAGYFYVYLCYGMHWMLNIVVREKDYPAAVLIRGVEHISGPGRVTKYFGIDEKLHGLPVHKKSGYWFESGTPVPDTQIKRTPRIGVAYAGHIWSKKKYRFLIK